MIDDDENVTMIDFPQMVSVSHRNAQMYFDRDVECIYKFFRKRFKLTYELLSDEADGQDLNMDENSRPTFCSILNGAASLDKELAASGFTKKDQDNLERFIEGTCKDSESGNEENSDDDSSADDDSGANVDLIAHDHTIDEANDKDIEKFESLGFTEQNLVLRECDAVDNELISPTTPSSYKEECNDDEEGNSEEGDAELTKRLGKQRRRAIASAHRRQNLTSRNSYKDKGGKSSQNSKIQKQQLGGW